MFDNQFQRVLWMIYTELGGPIAEKAIDHLETGDWRSLFAMKVNPGDYSDSETYWRDNQVCELLRKIEVKQNSKELEAAALQAFWDSERQCHLTNIRLNKFLHKSFDDMEDLRISGFINACRSFIKSVLGPVPHSIVPIFGKGSTFSDRGNLITVADKMSSEITSTVGATSYRIFIDESAWGRAHLNDHERQVFSFWNANIVRGNRFTTVPKDNSKRRGICIEPSLNVSLQLPIGSYLKGRLKKHGLDLCDGQEVHQLWAKWASRDGAHATVDLSNASDTISKALVRLLLPPGWWQLLNDLRSPCTLMPDGRWCMLEKFSSMGNGFTFELETLIFASILSACGCRIGVDTLVYGDDMIVPTELVTDCVQALRYFGFTPNMRKTFTAGHFRESCGGDFFNFVSVRAHYITEEPNEPQDWFVLLNGLRRSSKERAAGEDTFYHARKRILDQIPSRLRRLTGPELFGDAVIHSEKFERIWERPGEDDDARGIGWIRGLIPYSPTISYREGCWHPEVVLACALYGCPSQGVTERDTVHGYRVGWLAMS